jgi:VIT1/CCC1 family predicted Fe2+/Mn2+ transporter
MGGSSATLPRNRQALRVRERALEARRSEEDVERSFARIAQAMQPDEPTPAARTAIFVALGSIFGFAAAWLAMRSLDGWYVMAALGMAAGGFVGAVAARLSEEPR